MASLATTSLISAPTRPRFRSLRQALSIGPSSVSFIRFPHLPPVYSKAGSSSPQISCVVKQQIIEQVAGIVMKQLTPVIPADGQVISGVFPFSTLDADSLDTIPELKLEARNVTVDKNKGKLILLLPAVMCGLMPSLGLNLEAHASEGARVNMVYEVGELFELGIQLIYLVILLGLLGVGTFYVLRQVLVRRELDLSAKELQEQVRSGDASATEYFELGAVMLRRKFYPAAIKYLQQAVDKWDGDNQDLAQVYNALGVSYVRDNKLEKGIQQFESAVKVQPGYVTAWNNLGDAYEKKKDLTKALKAFEEVLLFDPNNKVARPRRDALKERVQMYKGIPVKSENQ